MVVTRGWNYSTATGWDRLVAWNLVRCVVWDPINNRLDYGRARSLTFLLNRVRQMCSLALIQIGTSSANAIAADWPHTHFVDFCPDRNPHRFLCTAARASKIEGRFEEPTPEVCALFRARVYFLIKAHIIMTRHNINQAHKQLIKATENKIYWALYCDAVIFVYPCFYPFKISNVEQLQIMVWKLYAWDALSNCYFSLKFKSFWNIFDKI